jgi:hypothetical protein
LTDTENNTEANTEAKGEFKFTWPTDPPQEWWEVQGASVGMDSDTIRFAAALHNLGGAGSKKNTQAARLAGLDWNRVEAFRAAVSVSVRRLLTEARDIKRGKLPPLTEAEIDEKIDDLIRCPDALTVARGIELREKRKHSARGINLDSLTPPDDVLTSMLLSCRAGLCQPEAWPVVWAEMLLPKYGWWTPLVRQMAPYLKQHYPTLWTRLRRHLAGSRSDELKALENGPVLSPDQILEISCNNLAHLMTVVDSMGDFEARDTAFADLRKIGLIEQAPANKEATHV